MLKMELGPCKRTLTHRSTLRILGRIFALLLASFLTTARALPADGDDNRKPADSKPVSDKDKTANATASGNEAPVSDRELIEQLTQEIQELLVRVKQLEAKDSSSSSAASNANPNSPAANSLPSAAIAASSQPAATSVAPPSVTATVPPSAAPAPSAAKAAPAPNASSTTAPAATLSTVPAPDTDINEVAPRLHLNAYADLGYQATDEGHSTNSFMLGSFDLFMTSQLSDKASVLGEVIFLAEPDNTINVDLERLMFQYKFSDYFDFGIGRYHTDIGYYNATFHHIEWFSTPIGRPMFLNFDDFGGFLPLQEIGLSTNGNIPSGSLGLHYVFEVGNGRSHNPGAEPAQNRVDDNQGKSFNINVSAHPKALSGFVPGFSIYHDDLTAPDMPKIHQSIMDAYIVYSNARLEWLNEGLLIRNNPDNERLFYLPAFYTQVSYAFGKYRPYFRYAWENSNNADPLYGINGTDVFVSRQNDASVGVRYDVVTWAGIKLQYDRFSQRDMSGYDSLAIQFAFSF
jgi:hypothetical protein